MGCFVSVGSNHALQPVLFHCEDTIINLYKNVPSIIAAKIIE